MAVETKRICNGTFGELWLDGDYVGECYKAQAKVEFTKEEIKQCGTFFTDNKVVGCKGTGSLTMHKVNSRMAIKVANMVRNKQDVRFTLISKLADPDAYGAERVSITGVQMDDLTLFDWEAQKPLETEAPFTFKLIIINSDFGVASSTLVKAVQEAIDPDPQGTGSGIAPIGHTVTVVSAVGKTVSIKSRITLNDGYQWSQVKPKAEETLEAYFLEMRKNWEKGNLVVRISQIENRLLNLDGILDVADTQLNDVASNLALAQEEIPLLGGVYIG